MRFVKASAGTFMIATLIFSAQVFAEEFKPYFGNLHAHTSYSDGEGTPLDALKYARDVAKLDFMAVTDHMEYITPQASPGKWEMEKAQADEVNKDGQFVGIIGYEWGSPIYNHLNFFRIDHFFSADAYFTLKLNLMWNEVIKVSKEQQPPPIMQFNHPDWDPVPPFNWNAFEYNAGVAKVASLIEVKDPDQEKSYQMALDKGWHVSAVNNQDNHKANWGTQNDCRAVMWMPSLSRSGLYDAMSAGRGYASCDKNAVVVFKGNGSWMGSVVSSKPIKLEWDLADPDQEDTFNKVEVVTNSGEVLFAAEPKSNTSSGNFTVDPAAYGAYYYLRISMTAKNGNPPNPMVYTGPIYYSAGAEPDGGTQDSGSQDGGAGDSGTGDGGAGPEPSGGGGGCSCSNIGL